MERTILHCDCNSFFASVEGVLNPELKKYAYAVCGDPEYRHGIILAKNELAKKYGVKTEDIRKVRIDTVNVFCGEKMLAAVDVTVVQIGRSWYVDSENTDTTALYKFAQ